MTAPMTPGWYPDPSGGPRLRWFNGAQWTDQYSDGPQEARFTIHYGFALIAALSLLITVFFGVAFINAALNEDSIGAGLPIMWFLWGGFWTLVWGAFAVQHTIKGKLRRR